MKFKYQVNYTHIVQGVSGIFNTLRHDYWREDTYEGCKKSIYKILETYKGHILEMSATYFFENGSFISVDFGKNEESIIKNINKIAYLDIKE